MPTTGALRVSTQRAANSTILPIKGSNAIAPLSLACGSGPETSVHLVPLNVQVPAGSIASGKVHIIYPAKENHFPDFWVVSHGGFELNGGLASLAIGRSAQVLGGDTVAA
jgi:hypothetical protein